MRKTIRHKDRGEVFVFVHDAGGAEILAAYIHKNRASTHFIVYAGGPARAVCERMRIPFLPEPKRTELRKAIAEHSRATALLGTGGPRAIELVALKEAKRQGMKTAVYLDSWINYRERFGYPRRGWQKNIPDEIWTGDTAARSLARSYFPRTHVRLVPNQYFSAILARYRGLARHVSRTREILFMSSAGSSSEKLLADFLAECARRTNLPAIRVRMHPEDSRVNFEKIISRHGRGVRVELSREKDIVNDLLRARVVVGPETNALVPAHMLGIKTIRIVPKGEKAFLPFREIIRVKSAADAVRKIVS